MCQLHCIALDPVLTRPQRIAATGPFPSKPRHPLALPAFSSARHKSGANLGNWIALIYALCIHVCVHESQVQLTSSPASGPPKMLPRSIAACSIGSCLGHKQPQQPGLARQARAPQPWPSSRRRKSFLLSSVAETAAVPTCRFCFPPVRQLPNSAAKGSCTTAVSAWQEQLA